MATARGKKAATDVTHDGISHHPKYYARMSYVTPSISADQAFGFGSSDETI